MENFSDNDVLNLEENKILKNLMTMENRGYYVHEPETNKGLKIRGKIFDSSDKNSWDTGILHGACQDVLARLNIAKFQQININKRYVLFSLQFPPSNK